MADYETTSDDSPKSRFEDLKCRVRDDRRAHSEWYAECDEDFANYAGGEGQWKAADLQALKEEQKPWTTFNFIQPSVSAVNGMEVSNRQQVKFLPRTTQTAAAPAAMAPGMGQAGIPTPGANVPGADDQGPAETLSAANDYLRDQCDAEDEESDAFQDCAICGMGWTETRIGYDENPDGDMVVDRCDPGEMGWDRQATKRNLVDARHFHRVRTLDPRSAKEMFPGYELEEIDAAWARSLGDGKEPHNQDAADQYRNDRQDSYENKKTITSVEITWYDVKTVYTVANVATGEVIKDQTKDQVAKLKKRAAELGIMVNVAERKKREYRYAFLGANSILVPKDDEQAKKDSENGTLCQSQKGFKFKAITGWRNRNKKQWMGIVRAMRDPQKWANALYSSTLNTLMTSGKGIMAERSAFENPNKAEADWSSSGNIVFLKEGALSGQNPKVMPKVPNPLPPGIEAMMQFAIQAMRGVSGVNLETLGGVDRDQAASLEYQRRQAATTILAPFFDGLRRYRKEQGRLSMDLIKQYLSDGRLIRVVGPDYEKYVPLIKQDETLEYDIVVSESPTSPNQKEASWGTIQAMLPVVGKNLGPRTMAALMKASPLPETTVKEFKDAAEQEQRDIANAPPPPEVLLTEAQIRKTEAETELKKQDLLLNQQAAVHEASMKTQDYEQQKFERGIDREIKLADFKDRGEQRTHDRATRDMDMRAKQSEIDAQQEAEGMKMFGKDFPTMIQTIAAGQQQQSQAMQALAEAIKALAQAQMAPRVSEMVIDGQVMQAVTRPELN